MKVQKRYRYRRYRKMKATKTDNKYVAKYWKNYLLKKLKCPY